MASTYEDILGGVFSRRLGEIDLVALLQYFMIV